MMGKFTQFFRSLWRALGLSSLPKSSPDKSLRQIANEYFDQHPEARDGVMKAYYAFHAGHFRLEAHGHNFLSASRQSKCAWCGRSREQVRYDDLPAQCQNRPDLPEVVDAIQSEEERTFALLTHAEKDVPRLVAKMGMSGDTLAILHHTYGYDPETVASVINVPQAMLADYHAAMETEKVRSRGAQKRTVVAVKDLQ